MQGCVGFTAGGMLKSSVKPAAELDAMTDATACAGLYLRDLGSNPLIGKLATTQWAACPPAVFDIELGV